MMRFQWNALRSGATVRVHEDNGPELTSGTVETVDAHHGSNRVGIVVRSGDGAASVRWPSRLAVHLTGEQGSEPCWRCSSSVVI